MTPSHGDLHPAQHPVEPEHPLVVEGCITAGDTRWMLTCLFEELLRSGLGAEELRAMTRNPNYQALHAARAVLGDESVEALLGDAASRIGVHRIRLEEEHSCPIAAPGSAPCAPRPAPAARLASNDLRGTEGMSTS